VLFQFQPQNDWRIGIDLVEISSTRQLVVPVTNNIGANNALLYGSIQYDLDSVAIRKAKKSSTATPLLRVAGLDFPTSISHPAWRSLEFS